MTTQKKDGAGEKKSRVKVGKLQVNKETVKDLTDKETEQIKGGAFTNTCNITCAARDGGVDLQPGTTKQSDSPLVSFQMAACHG